MDVKFFAHSFCTGLFVPLIAFGDPIDCGQKDGRALPCWTDYLGTSEGDESLPYYPYAKRPNGCSVPPFRPGTFDVFVVDGLQFDFGPACSIHDRCYYSLGSQYEVCNSAYHIDLMSACANGVPSSLPNTFADDSLSIYANLTPTEKCERRGDIFYYSVAATASKYHAEAQTREAEYLGRIDEFLARLVLKFP